MMIHHNHEQGSPEWLESRRGAITGSRFKDARARLKSGSISKACIDYAMDLARERCGGKSPDKFVNAAMRSGREQEPIARLIYERRTGNLVDEVGFFTTEDGCFGLSPDGLIDDDGVLEVKTLVSSETLFKALSEHDISEYTDQCLGYLWLLGRKWVDLVLWVPDLKHMKIIRIARDEEAIERLEKDMLEFAKVVKTYEDALLKAMGKKVELVEAAPIPEASTAIEKSEIAF